MKKITKTVLFSAIIVAMAFTQTAYAKGRPMRDGRGPGDGQGRLMRVAAKLELTTAQQDQIKQLHAELQADMLPFKEKMDKIRVKIDQLWQQQPVDEKALMGAIEKAGRIKIKMRKMRVEHKIDMLEVLNPEQREKFLAHQKERRQRRMERRFHRRGPGKGQGPRGNF